MQPYSALSGCIALILSVAMAMGCVSAPPLTSFKRVAIRARGDSREIDGLGKSIIADLIDIGGRLGLPVLPTGLEIYLFDSPWEMRRFLRQHCPEQSGKAAACFSRPEGYIVTAVKSSQIGWTDRLLRHELTHFLLASNYSDIPRWVDEGLAQFLEADFPEQRDDKLKQLRKLPPPRLETTVLELISLPSRQPLDSAQYLLSWAVVSFLMQEERLGLDRIKHYLATVNDDGNARSYFEASFGSVQELRPSWESFLTREGLAGISPPDKYAIGNYARTLSIVHSDTPQIFSSRDTK